MLANNGIMGSVKEEEHDSNNDFTYLSYCVLCNQVDESNHRRSWLFLDNQSTVNIFYNKALLKNIPESGQSRTTHCDEGTTSTNLIGELLGYGTAWYLPNGIANNVSLSWVNEKYKVTFDSTQTNQFFVHKDDGSKQVFNQTTYGLYHLDVSYYENNAERCYVHTVRDGKTKYSVTDYVYNYITQWVVQAFHDFKNLVENNVLKKISVTRRDMDNAHNIFGPGSLMGKTTQSPLRHMKFDTNGQQLHENKNLFYIIFCIRYTIPGMNIKRHLLWNGGSPANPIQ